VFHLATAQVFPAVASLPTFESPVARKQNRLTALAWNVPNLTIRLGMEIDPPPSLDQLGTWALPVFVASRRVLLLRLGKPKCRVSGMAGRKSKTIDCPSGDQRGVYRETLAERQPHESSAEFVSKSLCLVQAVGNTLGF
jgi:hypothetical protein